MDVDVMKPNLNQIYSRVSLFKFLKKLWKQAKGFPPSVWSRECDRMPYQWVAIVKRKKW